ncbi:MAG: tetratricopeptide repeat protein [Gammaproteobacteria bacterium]|nr:tetratricopeptide repeat protein [Gammaproteobacteria bacterium]MCF6230103.1 tetratricopeptide repeat protein [Gammaproteobacteria bacterium]
MYKKVVRSPGFVFSVLSLLLLLLIAVTYQQNSNNTFHFDDRYSILEHAPIHVTQFSFDNLWDAGVNAYHSPRPLPSVTFAVDWWRGGGSAAAFLQTNLLIHSINALLVMGLFVLLLQRYFNRSSIPIMLAAFSAAALWALHPIQVQGVSYIVQRMTSLATLFTLLSVVSYLLARSSKHTLTKISGFAICLISLLAGMMSKELAWITPLLILLAEYCVVRNRATTLFYNRFDRTVLILPIASGMILALLAIADVGALGRYFHSFYAIRDFTMEERLLTQPRVIFFYLSQVFWPLPDRFSLEHDFVLSRSLFNPVSTLVALLAIVAWCMTAIYLWSRRGLRIIAFLMLWLPVTLSVESSFIGLEMVFEHRMYLPLVGLSGLFAVGLAYLLQRYHKMAWPLLAVTTLLIAGLATATFQRIPEWQTTEALLINSTQHAPNSARSWSNLGRYYIDQGHYDDAIPNIEHALKLEPDNASVLEAMGTIFLFEGRLVEARSYLIMAYRTQKTGHSWLNNMAWLHLEEVAKGVRPDNFLDKALDFTYQARRLAPFKAEYVRMSAIIQERMGRCADAYQSWQYYLQFTLPETERINAEAHLARRYLVAGNRCQLR